MSTYERDYSKLTGNAKRAKAIEDIIEWLGGMEAFVKYSLEIQAEYNEENPPPKTPDALRFSLSLIGVQGYPVKAWFELLFGEYKGD